MISAMYENGGNTLQRHLDGHTSLFTYPFESQVGTKRTSDYLESFVPHKYRWPQIQLEQDADAIFDSIHDEEVKILVNAPHMSKFKEADFQLSEKERRKIFKQLLSKEKVSRAKIVECFYRATFQAWKNYNKSGKEKIYVGYNPVQILDADKIISDFPGVKILHIVRNPFSAYAETKRRPVPLSLDRYIRTWNAVQLEAINFAKLYPDNVIIVRFEDMVSDKKKFFSSLSKKLDISFEDSMLYPSWNGLKLENIYPWGTVQYPTVQYNDEKKKELSSKEIEKIEKLTHFINLQYNY